MGPKARYMGPEVPNEDLIWQDPVPAVDHPLVDEADIQAPESRRSSPPASRFRSWSPPHGPRPPASAAPISAAAPTVPASASLRRRTGRSISRRNWPASSRRSSRSEATSTPRPPAARRSRSPTSSSLPGAAAVEKAAKDAGIDVTVPFTPGRTDASQEQTDAESFAPLEPKVDGFRSYGYNDPEPAEVALLDKAQLMRLTAPELTALIGGLRVLNTNYGGTGFGVFTDRPGTLTNDFFVNLLDMKYTWKPTRRRQEHLRGPRAQIRRGKVEGHPRRPDLWLERTAPGALRGLRLLRLPPEVRQRLRQRVAQGDEPRPLRHHPHRLADRTASRRCTLVLRANSQLAGMRFEEIVEGKVGSVTGARTRTLRLERAAC